jgi:uncharacterized protein
MKTTKAVFALGALVLTTMISCSKEENDVPVSEDQAENRILNQPSQTQLECSYVDAYWSSTAYLSTTIGTTAETSFMNTQNSKIAAVWGRPAVTLRFVKDASNPNSTFNAISYSTKKIYYGEAIFNAAKAKGQIVNAMILAHEFGHQLQYTYGIPSVNESTARAGELEADGMAGYYLRRPTGYNQTSFSQIAAAYEFAASIGDNCTTCPSHHGTAPQRRSAVRLGFLLGQYSLTATSFDSNFFYYYSGVLNGTYKQAPEGFNPEMDIYIKSHSEELERIMKGEMSDEEYFNLD